jgi:hypothetical protein
MSGKDTSPFRPCNFAFFSRISHLSVSIPR